MPAASLLPVVLLASKRIVLPRNAIVMAVVFAIIFPLTTLILSPGIALANHLLGIDHHGGHFRLLAERIEKNWRGITDQPLRLIGSTPVLANGVAFYVSDRPSTVNILAPARTPWADDERIKREGIAVFCTMTNQRCINKLEALVRGAAESRTIEVTITRRYFGIKDVPVSYTVALIAPEWLPFRLRTDCSHAHCIPPHRNGHIRFRHETDMLGS
jgi:hypothetical protein